VLSTDELSYGMPCEQQARVRISDEAGGYDGQDFAYLRMAFGYDHVSELTAMSPIEKYTDHAGQGHRTFECFSRCFRKSA